MRRVVITGIGGITSLGNNWHEIKAKMEQGITAVKYMPEWENVEGLNTKLAAPLDASILKNRWSRKKTRAMGTVALYSIFATEQALEQANLLNNKILQSGKTGVAYGSSFGSVEPMYAFADLLLHKNTKKLTATSYIKMMSHTTAVNIGLHFGLMGRILPTSTACTSGSLAIGYGYENIRSGKQDIILAGGAEELCPSMACVFDVLYATSTKNDKPNKTPSPYDKDRDGIVIGEGAVTFVLEEYEHAKKRNAPILAEIVGFGTNTDGNHVTQPTASSMETALKLALEDSKLNPNEIGFVSGHGTATEHGDIAETTATNNILGSNVAIHSLKSYFGHTLGACGSLESWLAIEMMRDGKFYPTANLENVDERCAPLNYLKNKAEKIDAQHIMCNNFAFGGINTSLIFKKWTK